MFLYFILYIINIYFINAYNYTCIYCKFIIYAYNMYIIYIYNTYICREVS